MKILRPGGIHGDAWFLEKRYRYQEALPPMDVDGARGGKGEDTVKQKTGQSTSWRGKGLSFNWKKPMVLVLRVSTVAGVSGCILAGMFMALMEKDDFASWLGALMPILAAFLMVARAMIAFASRSKDNEVLILGLSDLGDVHVPMDPTRFQWKQVGLHHPFKLGRLVRAMADSPWQRYFIDVSLKPSPIDRFLKRGGLNRSISLMLEGLSRKSLENWFLALENPWRVSLVAGIIDNDETARNRYFIALESVFPGSSFEKMAPATGWSRRRKVNWAGFMGRELVDLFVVPHELVPSIRLGTPVEMATPVQMQNDVVIGKVIESETLQDTVDAGFLMEHFIGGIGIFGGKPLERIALVKLMVSRTRFIHRIIIDDHGDFHVPGARILRPGDGILLNPITPATRDGVPPGFDGAWDQHVENLVNVLSIMFQWSPEKETRAWNLIRRVLARAASENCLVQPRDLINECMLPSDQDGRTVRLDVEIAQDFTRLFANDNEGLFTMRDMPAFPALVAGDRDVILELSGLHGVVKQFVKALVLLKLQGVLGEINKNILVIIPEIDKMLHDVEKTRMKNAFSRKYLKFIGILAARKVYMLFSAQHASLIPSPVLNRLGGIVALRQEKDDAIALEQPLHLEPERIFGQSSRHVSHQRRFMENLPAGRVVVHRDDIPSAFIAGFDFFAACRLLPPRHADVEHSGMEIVRLQARTRSSPLEIDFEPFSPLLDGVISIIDALVSTPGEVKQDVLTEYWGDVLKASLGRRGIAMAPDAEERYINQQVAALLNFMLRKGYIVKVEIAPTGLVTGVALKVTEKLKNLYRRHLFFKNDPWAAVKDRLYNVVEEIKPLVENDDVDRLATLVAGEISFMARELAMDPAFRHNLLVLQDRLRKVARSRNFNVLGTPEDNPVTTRDVANHVYKQEVLALVKDFSQVASLLFKDKPAVNGGDLK